MSNLIFVFDTETTGLPEWKIPSDDPKQPHLVQVAGILVDLDTRKIVQSFDLIIKPEGWEFPEEVSEIHGITQEKALEVGVSEKDAISMLLQVCGNAKRVAHNRTFDQRIIRIGLKRYFSDEIQEKWADKENFDCTMLMSKPVMELPPKGRYGYKNPKLEEAYKFFTGKELENAHSAMADTQACMEVYFGLMDRK